MDLLKPKFDPLLAAWALPCAAPAVPTVLGNVSVWKVKFAEFTGDRAAGAHYAVRFDLRQEHSLSAFAHGRADRPVRGSIASRYLHAAVSTRLLRVTALFLVKCHSPRLERLVAPTAYNRASRAPFCLVSLHGAAFDTLPAHVALGQLVAFGVCLGLRFMDNVAASLAFRHHPRAPQLMHCKVALGYPALAGGAYFAFCCGIARRGRDSRGLRGSIAADRVAKLKGFEAGVPSGIRKTISARFSPAGGDF